MSVLSDVDIRKYVADGAIFISPYEAKNVQGATIDLILGKHFKIPDHFGEIKGKENGGIINLYEDVQYRTIEQDTIYLPPKQFILGATLEEIGLVDRGLCARVDGKSGLARRGLIIQSAGHIGPGFRGNITLELYNLNDLPIKLEVGKSVCQIEFQKLSSPTSKKYEGRFSGQDKPIV